MKHGFLKIAVNTPEVKTLDIRENTRKITDSIVEAHTLGVQLLLLPRLAVTGYALKDTLFFTRTLTGAEDAAREIAAATQQRDIAVLAGLPVAVEGRVYDCMALFARGQVAGLVPRSSLTREELRYFSPGAGLLYDEADFAGFVTPFSPRLLIRDAAGQLTAVVADGGNYEECASLGANLVLQTETLPLYASSRAENFQAARAGSGRHKLGLAYAGASIGESASEYVYDTDKFLVEAGETLARGAGRDFVLSDIDLEKLSYLRSKAVFPHPHVAGPEAAAVEVRLKKDSEVLDREFERLPYAPKTPEECKRVMEILALGLYSRIAFTDAASLVVGVSGGLDSTMALLVADKVCADYDFPRENVICVTMPCFATSERTAASAGRLIAELGMTHRHIPIHDAVEQHLAAIGHTGEEDTAYENAQARERTQILLDIANMERGLMLGTSDMSEAALGFSTFGGDQVSMYQAIVGLPKTAIRALMAYLAETAGGELGDVLVNVLDTPVSPELKRGQATEHILGAYELHDFFLYHFLTTGAAPEKILFLASKTFPDYPDAEIKQTLRTFLKRFFAAQFKRSASADGVQVFEEGLSSFRMNADVAGDIFRA